ncbi:lactonase family protein [Bifidobacterium miconisargentati]|uniref:lactonase family protein n=1 Tax=Bifidobacterium miconisargentati TaxID=2834437 RepID=UPI001F2E4453|nr:beta-propeller fold lactonase family protein [Bifidobacterium miconisargentati]
MNDSVLALAVGGFGATRGSSCPGIESVSVRIAHDGGTSGNDGDAASDTAASSVTLLKDGLLADVPSPTWIERDGDLLYAVLEDTNEVAAFRVGRDDAANVGNAADDAATDGSGERMAAPTLTELSRVAAQGVSPTHAAIAIDDLGAKHLIVACYADGHVSVFPIAANGAVLDAAQVLTGEGHGPLPAQEGPHAHWILPLPDGRVLSTDLGADRIYVHRWNTGVLERVGAVTLAPGTGPRDMHLLPAAGDAATQWRVAVVDEWGNTVTLLGPEPVGAGDSYKADTNLGIIPEHAGDHGGTAAAMGHSADGIAVLQTVDLGGDPLDQAASLAFVPWSTLRGDAPDADADGKAGTHDITYDIAHDSEAEPSIAGIAYVGLRGSERIVALGWNGERLSRMAPTDEPGWRGRGIDCGGSRPRHILPVGDLLLVANEVSNNLTVFRLAADGTPIHATDLPSGSPTVFVRL